jgi:hypothetical protein
MAIVNEMRAIGLFYLARHPRKNFFHSNQKFAEAILNFTNMDATNVEVTHFLLEIYYQLPNFNGELAKAIADFMVNNLKINFTPQFLMKNISVTTIKNIGQKYLELYPKPTPWYSLFRHTNQEIARSMAEGKTATKREIPVGSNFKAVWLSLVDCYSWLPNAKGQLAAWIDQLMWNVNRIYVEKVEVIGRHTRSRSPDEIANTMRSNLMDQWHSQENSEKKTSGKRH